MKRHEKLFKKLRMLHLLTTIYFYAYFASIAVHCSPLSFSNSTQSLGEGINLYYENEEELDGRQKRLVISGLAATITWSILFTPLATMTVSKNFDILDMAKRCNERRKSHFEGKHPLTAFWESIACKETETETRGKIVLIEIVTLAFQHLTPEARELIALEYAVFEQKMAKLRGDKDQQERLEWNVPGHRGKIFLCFLREFVLFDEHQSNSDETEWISQFDNNADKGRQFWRHCEKSILKRRGMNWKQKMGRSMERWWKRRKSTFECAVQKFGQGFGWVGQFFKKLPFLGMKDKIEKEEKEKERIEEECAPWKSVLEDLRESAKMNDGLEWPEDYLLDDPFDGSGEYLLKDFDILEAGKFFGKMSKQFGAKRHEPLGIFAKYIQVDSKGKIWMNWEIQRHSKLYYPRKLRAIIDKTLEEAKKTLEYYGLAHISEEQKRHFAIMEIRTAMANFFVELRKSEELRGILFPRRFEQQNGFAQGAARDIFSSENEINKDWLVAGNDLHMDDFQEIFLIQEGNKDLYRQIFVDALLEEKKPSKEIYVLSKGNELPGEMGKEKVEQHHGREKRALGAVTTLLFGIGMQQGYRHFNLIQLMRDCTIRSINYKSARCYPPPIIQEEIKFVQKAKEIAFQELTQQAVIKIGQKLGFYVKENLRRKNALVDVPLELLEKNLNLIDPNLDRLKSVPIPIKCFKNLEWKMHFGESGPAMIAVPSEQLREAIEATNQIPMGKESLKKLADAIIQNATVQIPLETYLEWENELDLGDKLGKEEIEYFKKRHIKLRIKGRVIGQRLRKLAEKMEKLENEKIKWKIPIPNPKETLAPILKPGYFIDVELKFFTQNENLDEFELLHIPMVKLKELFKGSEGTVKITVPINFLEERYKEPTLSVPFGQIREWVGRDENVPISINDQFLGAMRANSIRAIPVPTIWLAAHFDKENIVHVAGEHFIQDYEEIYDNKSANQFPMTIELENNFKSFVKCIKLCPKRHFIRREDFLKPIAQPQKELKFTIDQLENIDYLPLKMERIKHYMDEERENPRCPKNILVTLDWLENQKKMHENDLEKNGSQFIVPILRKFFDDFVFKKAQKIDKKLKGNDWKENSEKSFENVEFTVALGFLAEIMKSTQKIPVPSQMLLDAGLELPWKYSLYLDCNAEYLFYDEATLNRCKIYRQELERIRAAKERKENGQEKQMEMLSKNDDP